MYSVIGVTESSNDLSEHGGVHEDMVYPWMRDVFRSSKGLHFLHLNIRSLIPKIEEVRIVARESNAAVIGLTETWLDSSVKDSELLKWTSLDIPLNGKTETAKGEEFVCSSAMT